MGRHGNEYAADVVAFDTETTGLGHAARIVQVGLVGYRANGERLWTYGQLVNPGPIDWSDPAIVAATRVTGIGRDEVAGAPSFAQICGDVLDRLSVARDVVAHNLTFDLYNLASEVCRCDRHPELPMQHAWCTMLLDFWLCDGLGADTDALSFKLQCCCERHGIEQSHWHDALADADATARLWLSILSKRRPTAEGQAQAATAWARRLAAKRAARQRAVAQA